MMIVAVVALIALIIVVLASTRKTQAQAQAQNQNQTKAKNPPGPSGLPLLGNLLQFDRSKPLIYLLKLSHKYGPLTYLKHGSTPTLVVSSAKLAKQILKAHDVSLCTRPPVLAQQKFSYNGVDMAFSPYNSHWKETRRMCMHHLFSPKQVLSFRPIREDQVARMMNRISALARSSQPANLSDMAMSLASNIICGLAFGRTYDEHEYEKIRLDRLVLEAQALMVSFYFSDHFPPALFGWLDKASGLLGRVDKNFLELDAFYQQLIDEHLHSSTSTSASASSTHVPDIIDLMLQLKRDKPESITWDHIKALLMDLFVAGTDTVAAAIVWTMTGLMLKPAIMKRTQAHIRQAMGCKEGMINEDDICKLPYLKAVVMEALRLYPPAPLLYRTQVPDHDQARCSIGGYEVEAGTTFIINGWAIARDPETWEDPDEFVPERFMTTNRAEEFEMFPFGGGRRRCPGMGMGLVSIHLALANLLYSFDWALPPSAPIIDTDSLPGLTMHKKNPLLLLPIDYIHSSS